MWLVASNTTMSAREPTRRFPTSLRRNAWAPAAVADHNASSQVMPILITASAITSGIDAVYEEPGLQSDANATVTPASISLRASGNGERVHSSAVGSSVATVVLLAPESAPMSS